MKRKFFVYILPAVMAVLLLTGCGQMDDTPLSDRLPVLGCICHSEKC